MVVVKQKTGRQLEMPGVEESPEGQASREKWDEAKDDKTRPGLVFGLISGSQSPAMQKFKRHGVEGLGLRRKALCL